MNVDTQFAQPPVATAPERPVQAAPEQVSSRPAERPGRDEPAGSQTRQGESAPDKPVAYQNTGSPPDQTTANEPGNLLDVIV